MASHGEYLSMLDADQLAAVSYMGGHSLVIAGAGAGKTRVLTSRAAFLVDHGIPPWRIMALTFTNKAAREMRQRIAAIVGPERAASIQMGTFHSVFSRLLRIEADTLGYSPRYTIYDRSDSVSLLRLIIKTLGLDASQHKQYKAEAVMSRISWAKNRLLLPPDYMAAPDIRRQDAAADRRSLGEIYEQYQRRLKNADAMDFDDLLVNMHQLLSAHPDICAKYAQRFTHILVDEYQDTNHVQAATLRLLAAGGSTVCAVGDDAQSIYAFRGADIGNILNFSKTFPGAKLLKLERNYRSTSLIVDAAESVIAHNKGRIPKDVRSLTPGGDKLEIYACEGDLAEAATVARKLRKYHDDAPQAGYGGMAVLYRKNSLSRLLEEALRREGIPYRVYGGLSFYDRKEIRDAVAYFRLAVNPNDDEALRRIINYPLRGIGATTMGHVVEAADAYGQSLWATITTHTAFEIGIGAAAMAKISCFSEMMQRFISLASEGEALEVGKQILQESGLIDDISQDDTSDISRRDNIDELLGAMRAFSEKAQGEGREAGRLSDFLSEIALLTDADRDDDGSADRVTLTTVHSAKGLEFATVIIMGLEEGTFPSAQSLYDKAALEEERRLLYVAVTRARRRCIITYARRRFTYTGATDCEPSRFLAEMDSHCVAWHRGGAASRMPNSPWPRMGDTANVAKSQSLRTPAPQAERTIDSATTRDGQRLSKGSIVEHSRFGRGTVAALYEAGDTVKATINFDSAGRKDLLLKFAPLSVVSRQ